MIKASTDERNLSRSTTGPSRTETCGAKTNGDEVFETPAEQARNILAGVLSAIDQDDCTEASAAHIRRSMIGWVDACLCQSRQQALPHHEHRPHSSCAGTVGGRTVLGGTPQDVKRRSQQQQTVAPSPRRVAIRLLTALPASRQQNLGMVGKLRILACVLERIKSHHRVWTL